MKKRLFIGFDLPESLKQKLVLNQPPLIRLVPKENLHITVLFIGYVEEEKISKIKNNLKNTTKKFKPITFKFDKIIFAPPGKSPRMIWAYFHQNETFEKLNKKLSEDLKEFKPDTYKQQHIHITLARFRKFITKRDLEDIKLPEVALEDFTVDKITLFESKLGSGGPVYKSICEFILS